MRLGGKEEGIPTMGWRRRQSGTDRPRPAILADRRNQVLETLATGRAVRDWFQLGDMNAMKLEPSALAEMGVNLCPRYSPGQCAGH
jgi:hypothetical protein